MCDRGLPDAFSPSVYTKAPRDLGGKHFRPHLIDEDTEAETHRSAHMAQRRRDGQDPIQTLQGRGPGSQGQNPPRTPSNGGVSQ